MTATVAAYIFTVLVIPVVLFQVALAVGMPWGALTWGGTYPGRLPGHMRVVAVISTVLLCAFAVIVLARSGALLPEWQLIARTLVWCVIAYCVLGVLANAVTPSRGERLLWLPVTLGLLVCVVLVAMS